MLSPDDVGRPDVLTTFATLPAAFGVSGGGCGTLLVPRAEARALVAAQRTALASLSAWRARDRSPIMHIGLICCLNIGTEPPEKRGRPSPHAVLEAWRDPGVYAAANGEWGEEDKKAALRAIGGSLVAQYTRLAGGSASGGGGSGAGGANKGQQSGGPPPPRMKITMDPSPADVEKLCTSLRRKAGGSNAAATGGGGEPQPPPPLSQQPPQRILIHYNGHGVPPPTALGDLWVFNRAYTQYVPLPVRDLVAWTGSPAFYVLDTDGAGILVPFLTAGQRPVPVATTVAPPILDVIVLAACSAGETIPFESPVLPADFFTACLTTPLRMSLAWALHTGVVGSLLPHSFRHCIDTLPGRLRDKRSPLGELDTLFVAITDTIAWTCLTPGLFLRLFRQDALSATLWRNFLLADRLLRLMGRVPVSHPPLPRPTHTHPLWLEWDSAVANVLVQLPSLLGYSLYDMQRLEALGLRPDADGARTSVGGDWGSDASKPEATGATVTSAGAAATGGVIVPPAPTNGSGGGGAAPPRQLLAMPPPPVLPSAAGLGGTTSVAPPLPPQPLHRQVAQLVAMETGNLPALSSLRDRRIAAAAAAAAASGAAASGVSTLALTVDAFLSSTALGEEPPLIGERLEPLSLPIPPAASATASQRVTLLRHRLRRFLPTVASGHAVGFGPKGIGLSFVPNTLLEDTLTSFEAWLRSAGWVASHNHAALAGMLVEGFLVQGGVSEELVRTAIEFRAAAAREGVESGGGGGDGSGVGGGASSAGGASGGGVVDSAVLLTSGIGGGSGGGAVSGGSSGSDISSWLLHLPHGLLARARHLLRGPAPLLLPLSAIKGLGAGLDEGGENTPRGRPALPTILLPRLQTFPSLPMVLQAVLHGQRSRAVHLLARFLDLGPEAGVVGLLLGLQVYILRLSTPSSLAALPGCGSAVVLLWARHVSMECGRATAEDLVLRHDAFTFLSTYVCNEAEARVREAKSGGKMNRTRSSATVSAVTTTTSPAAANAPYTTPTAVSDFRRELSDPTLAVLGDHTPAALYTLWRLLQSYPQACHVPAAAAKVLAACQRVLSDATSPPANKQWALLVYSALIRAVPDLTRAILSPLHPPFHVVVFTAPASSPPTAAQGFTTTNMPRADVILRDALAEPHPPLRIAALLVAAQWFNPCQQLPAVAATRRSGSSSLQSRHAADALAIHAVDFFQTLLANSPLSASSSMRAVAAPVGAVSVPMPLRPCDVAQAALQDLLASSSTISVLPPKDASSSEARANGGEAGVEKSPHPAAHYLRAAWGIAFAVAVSDGVFPLPSATCNAVPCASSAAITAGSAVRRARRRFIVRALASHLGKIIVPERVFEKAAAEERMQHQRTPYLQPLDPPFFASMQQPPGQGVERGISVPSTPHRTVLGGLRTPQVFMPPPAESPQLRNARVTWLSGSTKGVSYTDAPPLSILEEALLASASVPHSGSCGGAINNSASHSSLAPSHSRGGGGSTLASGASRGTLKSRAGGALSSSTALPGISSRSNSAVNLVLPPPLSMPSSVMTFSVATTAPLYAMEGTPTFTIGEDESLRGNGLTSPDRTGGALSQHQQQQQQQQGAGKGRQTSLDMLLQQHNKTASQAADGSFESPPTPSSHAGGASSSFFKMSHVDHIAEGSTPLPPHLAIAAAARHLKVLERALPDLMQDPRTAPASALLEACAAACVLASLADPNPSVRLEALATLSAWSEPATSPEHEAALVATAGVSLLDTLAGGTSLPGALRRGDAHHLPAAAAALASGCGLASSKRSSFDLASDGGGGDQSMPNHHQRQASDGVASATHPSPFQSLLSSRGASSKNTQQALKVGLLRRLASTVGAAFGGSSGGQSTGAGAGVGGSASASTGGGGIGGGGGGLGDSSSIISDDVFALLGLPVDFVQPPELAAAIHYASHVVAASAGSDNDGSPHPSLHHTAPGVALSDSWLCLSAGGTPNTYLLAVVKALGATGVLYGSAWLALVASTADPDASVAAAALAITRRIMLRLVHSCILELCGLLPTAPTHSSDAPPAATVAPPDAVPPAASSMHLYHEACIALWCSYEGPTLGFSSSGSIDSAVAVFYKPLLGPGGGAVSESTATLDPLSQPSLQRSTRHRMLVAAVSEGTALAAAAWDDATLRAVLESCSVLTAETAAQALALHQAQRAGTLRLINRPLQRRGLRQQKQRRDNDDVDGDAAASNSVSVKERVLRDLLFRRSASAALAFHAFSDLALAPRAIEDKRHRIHLRLSGLGASPPTGSSSSAAAAAAAASEAAATLSPPRHWSPSLGGGGGPTSPFHFGLIDQQQSPILDSSTPFWTLEQQQQQQQMQQHHQQRQQQPTLSAAPGRNVGTSSSSNSARLLQQQQRQGSKSAMQLEAPPDLALGEPLVAVTVGGSRSSSVGPQSGPAALPPQRLLLQQQQLVQQQHAQQQMQYSLSPFILVPPPAIEGVSSSLHSRSRVAAITPLLGPVSAMARPSHMLSRRDGGDVLLASEYGGQSGRDEEATAQLLRRDGAAAGAAAESQGRINPADMRTATASVDHAGSFRHKAATLATSGSGRGGALEPEASAQEFRQQVVLEGVDEAQEDALFVGGDEDGAMSAAAAAAAVAAAAVPQATRSFSTIVGAAAAVPPSPYAGRGGWGGSNIPPSPRFSPAIAPHSSMRQLLQQPPPLQQQQQPAATVAPVLPPHWVTEEGMDAHLRSVAAITPRLSPSILSRTPAAAVRLARASARKLTQRGLIDTGPGTWTTGLLFHPTLDLLLVSDAKDVLSAWDVGAGASRCACKWRTTTGGALAPTATALWTPAWTTLLRKWLGASAHVLPRGSAAAAAAHVLGGSLAEGAGLTAVSSRGTTGSSGGSGGSFIIKNSSGFASGGGGASSRFPPAAGASTQSSSSSSSLRFSSAATRRGLPESFKVAHAAGKGELPPHTSSESAAAAAAAKSLASLARLGSSSGGGKPFSDAHEASFSTPAFFMRSPCAPPRVTSMTWVDEHEGCHLLSGAADGTVRVWNGGDIAASLSSRSNSSSSDVSGVAPSVGSAGATLGGGWGIGSMAEALGGHAAGGGVSGGDQSWRPSLLLSFSAMPELAHRVGAGGIASNAALGGTAHPAAVLAGHGAGSQQPQLAPAPSIAAPVDTAEGGGGATFSSTGLLSHWLPASCTLVAAGGQLPFVRLWDLATQRCSGVLHTAGTSGGGGASANAVTCLSSAWPGDSVLVVGTAGGAIHVLDTRLSTGGGGAGGGAGSSAPSSARSALVMTLREHSRYVVNVAQARSASAYALVSGSVASDVRSWDLRLPRCVHTFPAHPHAAMSALSLHDYAPLLATGSARQAARVYTNTGELLTDVRFHEGFAGARIGAVSALGWHPHRLTLAIGATDRLIDIVA